MSLFEAIMVVALFGVMLLLGIFTLSVAEARNEQKRIEKRYDRRKRLHQQFESNQENQSETNDNSER